MAISALAGSVAGLYWVGHAFLVDAERYVYLMPFAVIGIAHWNGKFLSQFHRLV